MIYRLFLLVLLILLPTSLPFLLTPTATSSSSLLAKPRRPSDSQPTTPSSNPNFSKKQKASRPFRGTVVPSSSSTTRAKKTTFEGKIGGRGLGVMEQGKERKGGISNVSRLKILGGTHKNRILKSPDVYLRPMMGKVKEALFSTLRSFGLYAPSSPSVKWLDVFCGSGSVGLESLSRSHKNSGGGVSVFVDFAEDCCQTVRDNLALMSFEEMGYPVKSDAIKALTDPVSAGITSVSKFDVVSITPPYEEVVYADLMEAVCNSPVVGEDTVVVIEYPVELGSLPHVVRGEGGNTSTLVGVRNRKYGRTVIAIYVADPSGRMEGAESRPEEFISLK